MTPGTFRGLRIADDGQMTGEAMVTTVAGVTGVTEAFTIGDRTSGLMT